MNYQVELLTQLNKALLQEQEISRKKEIAAVIKILTEKTLYDAAIYDFFTLKVNSEFYLVDFYKIPEIHQAFFDKIRNPNIGIQNNDKFIDIVYFMVNKLPLEEFEHDPQFIPFIQSLNYQQCSELFNGESTEQLLHQKKYYDLIVEMAKQDPNFISILPYNELSIKDENYKQISVSDKKGNKLVDATPEQQLIVLEEIALQDSIDLKAFLNQLRDLDNTIQEFIINNKKMRERLIKITAENKYSETKIPIELESKIISQSLEFISSLSYNEKCAFIRKLQDPEYQKYLIQKLNILKNLLGMTDYLDFLKQIKSDNFLAECLSDKYILESISPYNLGDLIILLSTEARKILTSSENFQNYYQALARYEKIQIIAVCGEEVIDRLISEAKDVSNSDYLLFFKNTKNHRYIQAIIDKLKPILVKPTEEDLQQIRSLVNNLRFQDIIKNFSEEEFTFFLNLSNLDEPSLIGAKNNLESSRAFEVLTPEEQELISNITSISEINEDQENALLKHRRILLAKQEVKRALEVIKSSDERIIKSFNYSILSELSEADQIAFLDHVNFECLVENISSCDILVNYCVDLYEKNPNIFDEISLKSNSYVYHGGDNLSPTSLDKLINLYKKLSDSNKEKILNSAILTNPEIANEVRNKIIENPNSYPGQTYKRILKYFLTEEELKKALLGLDVEELIIYYGTFQLSDEKNNLETEIIIARQDELISKIKSYDNKDSFEIPSYHGILHRLISNTNDLESLFRKFSPKMILEQYKETPILDEEKTRNGIILKLLGENPQILLTANKNTVKTILTNLQYNELMSLVSSFNIDEIMELFIITKNTELEEKIVIEFNNKPYFSNSSGKTIEEFLSRLDNENKTSIYNKISSQFEELDIPFDIKTKLRKSSLDEKMFLIYGIKENILDSSKLEYISELLAKDPFALNSLKMELFKPEVFEISKNIIPKIYRYEELTTSYIELLEQKNIRSRIMLLLLEYLNKITPNLEMFNFKMNCIITFLSKFSDELIDNFNIENITEQELQSLEEYIMLTTKEYWLEGQPLIFISSPKNDFASSFIDYEEKRILKIDEVMQNSNDTEEIKDCIFQKYFKINLEQAQLLIRRYDTSLNDIEKYISNPDTLTYFNTIKSIYLNNDLESLKYIYLSNPNIFDLDKVITLFNEFNKAYNLCIANSIKGYTNGQETTITISNASSTSLDVIELKSDFELIVHSTDAYGSMEMINDDYFDSWNYSERTANHGICTSFISSSNLGTAAVKGNGVMFGFTKLNEGSISLMAPYDLVSRNNDYLTTSRREPMFTSCQDLINYTRHTHNELVLERRNVAPDSAYPVIQPNCIIIFEEMTEDIKNNALKAQADFAKHGINLPIIYINRKKVVELEAQKIKEMLNIYDANPNLTLLAEIINKYESNRCGLDFEENINVDELFDKNRIYNTIIRTIELIKNNQDYESAKILVEIIEHENSKFTLIEENVGERAHTFDLLDEQLLNEIEYLKTNLISLNTNLDTNLKL